MTLLPRPLAASLAAMLLSSLPALAGDCAGLGPVGTPAVLFDVDGRNGPVFFVHGSTDRPGCPNDSAACRTTVSLPSGNRVVAGSSEGPWVCATHASRRSEVTTGWLPSASLTPVPETTPTRITDWAGRWRDSTGRAIRLTTMPDGSVLMRAEADAAGGRPRRGGRTSTVTAQFTPENAAAAFTIGADGTTRPDAPGDATLCRMALQRRGGYLIVQDNARCGGTSFTALYQARR
ncbi:hypothetical protein [Roseomonas sp. WA12]